MNSILFEQMNPELLHPTADYNSAEITQHFKSRPIPVLLRVYMR